MFPSICVHIAQKVFEVNYHGLVHFLNQTRLSHEIEKAEVLRSVLCREIWAYNFSQPSAVNFINLTLGGHQEQHDEKLFTFTEHFAVFIAMFSFPYFPTVGSSEIAVASLRTALKLLSTNQQKTEL